MDELDSIRPMTLDELIAHARMKSRGDTACAREHGQLAEWLTELKTRRELEGDGQVKALNNVVKRRDGIRAWLGSDHKKVFVEQAHVKEGTPERVYWHYGYMMALWDVLCALGLEKRQLTQKLAGVD